MLYNKHDKVLEKSSGAKYQCVLADDETAAFCRIYEEGGINYENAIFFSNNADYSSDYYEQIN